MAIPFASRRGLSLLETLLVIGLIGLLIALTLPAVQNVRATTARLSCSNNLRNIGLALHNFHDTHGRLPRLPASAKNKNDPNRILSWMASILPQMGEEPLYRTSIQACEKDEDPMHNPPHIGLTMVVTAYICPADGRLGAPRHCPLGSQVALTSYIGNAGGIDSRGGKVKVFLGSFPDSPRLTHFTDGTSTTIMVGERPPPDTFQAGWWYPGSFLGIGNNGPHSYLLAGTIVGLSNDGCDTASQLKIFGPGNPNNYCDRYHYWSLHSHGANFLFADGGVRFLHYSAEASLPALLSRNGGEVMEIP